MSGSAICTDCRRESGSAFTFFGVWGVSYFETTGETIDWEGREFYPACGSRLFSVDDKEVEIKLGALDEAPTTLSPTYELWVKGREAWLQPIAGSEQFDGDRP